MNTKNFVNIRIFSFNYLIQNMVKRQRGSGCMEDCAAQCAPQRKSWTVDTGYLDAYRGQSEQASKVGYRRGGSSCGRKKKQTGGRRRQSGGKRRSSGVRRRQSGGWKRPVRTSRKSGKSKHSRDLHKKGRKTVNKKKQQYAVGTRAQVSRGSAKKTRGGLKLDGRDRLFRDPRDNRIKSSKVSKQSRAKYNKNPAMQLRSQLVGEAFAQVRAVAGSRTIDSKKVMKNPDQAILNPTKFLKARRSARLRK